MNDKGPQMLADRMDVALLQREAIHRQWSPSPWGYWRENMRKIQQTSTNYFCPLTSKHYGVQLGSWATVYYMNMYMGISMHLYRPRGKNLCAIIYSYIPILYQYVPITWHACKKPTERMIPLRSSGQYILHMGEEDHPNTEQADQSSDAKPLEADSKHICQSWHLKTHNMQLEKGLRNVIIYIYVYII